MVKLHCNVALKNIRENYLERDLREAIGLFAPVLGEGILDFERLLLGDRDLSECADLDLDLAFAECSLGLRDLDLIESLDLERLLDLRAIDCGDAERECAFVSLEASISA